MPPPDPQKYKHKLTKEDYASYLHNMSLLEAAERFESEIYGALFPAESNSGVFFLLFF